MYYSSDGLKITKMPMAEEISEYKSIRIWNIVFKKELDLNIKFDEIGCKLSQDDLQVNLKKQSPNNLTMSIIYEPEGNIYAHDPIVIKSLHLIEDLEEIFGEIDTVEGQKMEERIRPSSHSKTTRPLQAD